MTQDIAFTSISDLDRALDDIYTQLNKNDYGAVLFFASCTTYDFPSLSQKLKEHFINSEVIGTSTSGEICSLKGFTNNTLVVTGIKDITTKFSGVLINNVDKFPIVQKEEIENAARKAGVLINSPGYNKDCFALTFINGLCNGEEATMALLHSIIGDDKFMVAGGSAGDDLQFNQTFVSVNGKCENKGAAVLFVKTSKKFTLLKENIFQPTGKQVVLTDVVPETRTILSIDGQNPRKRYCEVLGISESEAANACIQHPVGRVYGGHVFISSLASFNDDGTINMYSRVMKNSIVELLEPIDEITESEKTCKEALSEIPRPGCVILINCILRSIQFNQRHLFEKLTDTWKGFYGKFAGFSSYGEQYGRQNSNQTLVSIIIEE